MFENMILDILSKEIGISLKQVQQTVEFLEDGGTIPFISRYRKERTGGLDEVQVKSINDKHNELKEKKSKNAGMRLKSKIFIYHLNRNEKLAQKWPEVMD